MTIYTPESFAAHDRAAVARLMHDYPFATVVTPAAPEPQVSHLPLLLVPGCEPHGMLIGHFARANPHWRQARDVRVDGDLPRAARLCLALLVRCAGLDGADLELRGGPCAWHPRDCRGRHCARRQVLDALVQRFEHARPDPWQFQMPERDRDAMVGAIVAFRLRIRRIEGKFKLSQNRSAEDRSRVAAALALEGHAEAQATSAWMQQYAAPSVPDT